MRVIGLGAWCDYVTEDEYRATLADSTLRPEHVAEALEHFRDGASFSVAEFADLADGRRIWLHREERGFTTAVRLYFSRSAAETDRVSPVDSEPPDYWERATLDDIEHTVRMTVLPDDDDTEDEHPWEWLAELARAHGVVVTPEELKAVPYTVAFSDRLCERVNAQRGVV